MKAKKIILITAAIFVVFGAVIGGTAIMLITKANMRDMRMETQTITESISKVNVSADMSDIKIIADDSDKITLTYFTDETNKYDITTDNGTLSVEYARLKSDKVKWYDYYFSIDVGRDHDIILKVPKKLTADISLETNYGDIELSGINGSNAKVHTSYGDIELSGCKFTAIETVTDYGDIDIERADSEALSCITDCGDIEIERVSGKNITLNTSLGDIEGTILGNEEDYTINSETGLGENRLRGRTGGKNTLDAKTDLGDISVKFVK